MGVCFHRHPSFGEHGWTERKLGRALAQIADVAMYTASTAHYEGTPSSTKCLDQLQKKTHGVGTGFTEVMNQ
jgi:hypothetical protein